MKYAFMTFSCPDLSLPEVIELARRYGYDGIEPRTVADHAHGIEVDIDDEARADIRNAISGSGVDLVCIATSCMFADPATQDTQIEECLKAIDLAGDLDCPTIRVFGGEIGPGLVRSEAIDFVADSFRSVVSKAEERGVIVCMETHDDWCDPDHVAQIMERVDSTAVAVNWDIMHPVRMRTATMTESFRTLEPWIRHVHVHDALVGDDGSYTLEFSSIGTGYVDHKMAIELLESSGYAGSISGEWIDWSDHYDVHLPREIEIMKSYES